MSHQKSRSSQPTHEDLQIRLVEKLVNERERGLPHTAPWPTTEFSPLESRPICTEAVIAVPYDEFFSYSAQSFGDVKNYNEQQHANLIGLAAWLDVVTNGLAGHIDRIDQLGGYVCSNTNYNMRTSDDHRETRAKVEIDVIALPRNATLPLDCKNVACLLIRARNVDPEYDFSEALKLMLFAHSKLASGAANRQLPSGGQNDIRKIVNRLNEDPTRNLHRDEFKAELVYAIVMRPDHYRLSLLDWADKQRKKAIKKKYNELKEKKVKSIAAQKKSKNADAEAPEEEDGSGDVVLTEEDLDALRSAAKHAVEHDHTLPCNAMLEALNMNGEQRYQAAELLITSSIMEAPTTKRIMQLGGNPIGTEELFETRPACVRTFYDFVVTSVATFCSASEGGGTLLETLVPVARALDASNYLEQDVGKTALGFAKVFTMTRALDCARRYGADPLNLDIDDYYGQRGSLERGPIFDPTAEHSTVIFPPGKVYPTWGRSQEELERLQIECGSAWTDVTTAPFYARVPDSRLCRPIASRNARLVNLRNYVFWFTEDTTLSDIENAYEQETRASGVGIHLIKTVADTVARVTGMGTFDLTDDARSQLESLPQLQTNQTNNSTSFIDADVEQLNRVGGKMAEDPFVVSANSISSGTTDAVVTERSLAIRRVGGTSVGRPDGEPDLGMNSTYVSNFTMEQTRLQKYAIMMDQLAVVSPHRHMELMPKFRNYCAMAMARVYTSSSFNNGMPMRAVRKWESENWNADNKKRGASAAYRRVNPVSGVLSAFGNRVVGDIIALTSMLNVSIAHFLLWDNLTGTRAIACDTSSPARLHQIMISRSGDGKSHHNGILDTCAIKGTISDQLLSSTQSGVDAMANDDVIVYVDEAGREITDSGQREDPETVKKLNALRAVLGNGQISAARSCMGKFTIVFKSDCHVTYMMCANQVNQPENYELSMLMRIQMRRLPDMCTQVSNIYLQHNMPARALSVRKSVLADQWKGTQALLSIMGKMVQLYALPVPDTTVVSCFLEDLMSRIDAYYPRWQDSMRASRRVDLHCRGWAMFWAISMMFNSPLSPYAPERTTSVGRGFDVLHMMPCARYMYSSTEMLLMSVLWTLDEAVCTDAHVMMFALATCVGYRRASIEHLFVHGGRDHRSSMNMATHSNTVRVTQVGRESASITPDMREAGRAIAELHRRYTAVELEERAARFAAMKINQNANGHSVEVNCKNEEITPELRAALDYEARLFEWYASLTDTQRAAVDAPESGDAKYRYKVGGYAPEHWDRTRDQMPDFWNVCEKQLLAMEGRNNASFREDHALGFAPRDRGPGYNYNYIRYEFTGNNRDPVAAIERAIGYTVTRVNWHHVSNMYLRDRKAMMMTLPQLEGNGSSCMSDTLRWRVDANNTIVTERMPAVIFGRNNAYIDISVVWLFTGCYHNHIMDLATSLEDTHVPENGRTFVLPISNPAAPYLMQTIKLQRREGHVITVPNPAYIGSNSGVVGLSLVPTSVASSSLYSAINVESTQTDVGTDKISPGASLAMRAASDALNTVYHGLSAEGNRSMNSRSRKKQRAVRRHDYAVESNKRVSNEMYNERMERWRRDASAAESRGEPIPPEPIRDTVVPVAPIDPSLIESNVLLCPEKRFLTFSRRSVDDDLYADFLRRTGQQPGLLFSELDEATATELRVNTRVMREVYESVRTAAETAMEQDVDDDGGYLSDDDEVARSQLDGCSLENEGIDEAKKNELYETYKERHADYRDELGDAEEALGKHVQLLEAACTSYPGPFLPPTVPDWMIRNANTADQFLNARRVSALGESKPESIKAPPVFTEAIKRAYLLSKIDCPHDTAIERHQFVNEATTPGEWTSSTNSEAENNRMVAEMMLRLETEKQMLASQEIGGSHQWLSGGIQ